MNAAPLIRELRQAGIQLSATGDRLHVEAPTGTVTPELRQRIADNKTLLLAELRQPTTTTDTTDTRTELLALADRLAVDRDHVHRLADTALELFAAMGTGSWPALLQGLDDVATRQAGKVPKGETAAIWCERCGPVWTHPAVAAVLPVVNGWPRALGCRWCAIRKAGGYVPRPRITCEGCMHRQPDATGKTAGMGTCANGHGSHYPMQPHVCREYQPNNEVKP